MKQISFVSYFAVSLYEFHIQGFLSLAIVFGEFVTLRNFLYYIVVN